MSGTSQDIDPPLLEVSGVSKKFGEVVALRNVSFDVRAGEVHCVVGENGAGKSTLMNTLYGFNRPDSGTVAVDGRDVMIDSPRTALTLGIGMVHQHLMLVPNLTVFENIILGLKAARGASNRRLFREKTISRAGQMGISIPLDMPVESLALGQRQQVEILKALMRDARLVILDEPTSVLSPPEIHKLRVIVRALASGGTAVVLITHKLREAVKFSDRLTVMRAGSIVSTGPISSFTHNDIVRDMFGTSAKDQAVFVKRESSKRDREVRVSVHKLSVKDDRRHTVVDDVSFVIAPGEILGVAGVSGNGQSQLCEALAGTRGHFSGAIVLDDQDLNDLDPPARRNAGIAYIPEERRDGLAMELTVGENLFMNRFSESVFNSLGILKRKRLEQQAEQLGRRFLVPGNRLGSPMKLLSGGNQQRIALAKAFESNPVFVIASQPTIGLDLQTIEFVQSTLFSLRDQGASILYVSTELDELVEVSDRIAVMYRGRFVKIVGREDYSKDVLGPLMISGEGIAA